MEVGSEYFGGFPCFHVDGIAFLFQGGAVLLCEIAVPDGRDRSVSFLYLGRLTLKLLYPAHHVGTHFHQRSQIGELPAVVGSGEDCHQFPFKTKLVALLDYLVASADEIEVVSFHEALDCVFAVVVADSPLGVLAPAVDGGFGIRPQDIRDDFVVEHFHRSADGVENRQIFDLGGQSSMDAEYSLSNHSSNGHAVEGIGDNFPGSEGQPPLALIEEAV